MAVTGAATGDEVVLGFGGTAGRPLVTPVTNQSNKAVLTKLVGKEKVSELVVIKVAPLLLIRKRMRRMRFGYLPN